MTGFVHEQQSGAPKQSHATIWQALLPRAHCFTAAFEGMEESWPCLPWHFFPSFPPPHEPHPSPNRGSSDGGAETGGHRHLLSLPQARRHENHQQLPHASARTALGCPCPCQGGDGRHGGRQPTSPVPAQEPSVQPPMLPCRGTPLLPHLTQQDSSWTPRECLLQIRCPSAAKSPSSLPGPACQGGC